MYCQISSCESLNLVRKQEIPAFQPGLSCGSQLSPCARNWRLIIPSCISMFYMTPFRTEYTSPPVSAPECEYDSQTPVCFTVLLMIFVHSPQLDQGSQRNAKALANGQREGARGKQWAKEQTCSDIAYSTSLRSRLFQQLILQEHSMTVFLWKTSSFFIVDSTENETDPIVSLIYGWQSTNAECRLQVYKVPTTAATAKQVPTRCHSLSAYPVKEETVCSS
jgi:hypothetical protein